MAEEPLVEPKRENEEPETPTKSNGRARRMRRDSDDRCGEKYSHAARKLKGILLAMRKPSYCLKIGIGSSHVRGESLRFQHRKRLWRLLKELMRRHNWEEACGVLSLLLQAAIRDGCPSRNRAKYTAALRLLYHMKGENISSRKIQNVYDLWLKKLGPRQTKERCVVQSEFILTLLQRGDIEDAHSAVPWLMQERGFERDPHANLVVGLAFYKLWYSGIPKDLQLSGMSSSCTCMQSEVPFDCMHISNDYSKEEDILEGAAASCHSNSYSSSSIANNNVLEDESKPLNKPVDIDPNVKKEMPDMSLVPLFSKSIENGDRDSLSPTYTGDILHASIFYAQGLPVWLLPMKLPSTYENLDEAMYMHGKLHNDYYKSALEHLRAALYSTPSETYAFLPLIQLLLLGDQVHEALGEVKRLHHSSASVEQLRIKTSLLEHFDCRNYAKLRECYEDILKKNPKCSDSLARLICMHQRGEYDTVDLIEMIAMHLDASYGTCDSWYELASCFLKLSQCEGDRMSICYGSSDRYSQENGVPQLLTDGESGNSWKLRARWWLCRFFDRKNLLRDAASGDTKLFTYKAAAASYMYGRHFEYVTAATKRLEEENDMELHSFLQMHVLNAVGFYSSTS